MNAKVQINPNLRLPEDLTIVDLDEDVIGSLEAHYQPVEVYEPASGLSGTGWLVGLDQDERTATILVDWAHLTLPGPTRVLTMGLRSSWNEDLRPRATSGLRAAGC